MNKNERRTIERRLTEIRAKNATCDCDGDGFAHRRECVATIRENEHAQLLANLRAK